MNQNGETNQNNSVAPFTTVYTQMVMMTRFEVARIVGVRAMQLSEGESPGVNVDDPHLKHDYTYVAARELYDGILDVCVCRENELVHVTAMRLPSELISMLNTRDGKNRSSIAKYGGLAQT